MRVAFVATRCILDPRSGAAIQMRTVLEQLAGLGHDCHSVSMTRFDGAEGYPLARLVGAVHAADRNRRHFLEAEHRGVCHRLFYTDRATLGPIARDEAEQFARGTARLLARIRPELVLTTGADELTPALHRLVRSSGARLVFYLANPGYDRADPFREVDEIWCPTRALADLYRERLGLAPRIVRSVFGRRHFLDPPRAAPTPQGRFITLVNPAPEKGATLFFRLARLAREERPDLRFLAVDSRGRREQWRRAGIDPDAQGRIAWVRDRRDMRPVYRRTALLLAPSYCFEAAGRSAAEAQLSGVPVLAARRGGLPEQLNGGGHLFDLPSACLEDYLHVPTETDVRPWLERIAALIDDREAYAAATRRAREAAAPLHPEARVPRLADEIEAAAQGAPGEG